MSEQTPENKAAPLGSAENPIRVPVADFVQRVIDATAGHWQFADETGVWCREDCPMPDEECGQLSVEQNA